jgi:peroxiredoxin
MTGVILRIPRRQETAMQDLTGKPAIPFSLRDSRGGTRQLQEYRGKWLLMVFHRHLG